MSKSDFICGYCGLVVEGDLPSDWDLVLQTPVCPDCQFRVSGDGGYTVVKLGAYQITHVSCTSDLSQTGKEILMSVLQNDDEYHKELCKTNASLPQPPPAPGKTVVLDQVLKDIQERSDTGLRKYGVRLQTNNGRDALWDSYQEAIDLVMYLRQALLEREGK